MSSCCLDGEDVEDGDEDDDDGSILLFCKFADNNHNLWQLQYTRRLVRALSNQSNPYHFPTIARGSPTPIYRRLPEPHLEPLGLCRLEGS